MPTRSIGYCSGSKYRGHNIDDPLSEKGWQQMRQATAAATPWQHIVTSPLQRCHAFAQELGSTHNLPVSIEHDFKEIGFGNWEGKTREQLKTECLQEYEGFYKDPVNCRPEGAEELDTFIKRVTQAYQKHAEQRANEHILIIAHAGVIRAIIAHALNAPPIGLYRIQVDNAGITRIKHNKHGDHLLLHNK